MSILDEISSRQQLGRSWELVHKRGKETPGIDGVTLTEYSKNLSDKLRTLSFALKNNGFVFSSVLEKRIPKKNKDKTRRINIYTVEDKIVQKSIQHSFERRGKNGSLFPEIYNDVSVGFLRGTSGVKISVQRIKQYHKEGYCYLTSADIADFFDNINIRRLREIIFGRLGEDKSANSLIDQTLDPIIIQRDRFDPAVNKYVGSNSGVAQGSILAPLYSNIYLIEFDQILSAAGIVALRYADDLALFSKNIDDAKVNLDFVKNVLEQKLSLSFHSSSAKEPKHHNFNDRFAFLGIQYRIAPTIKPTDGQTERWTIQPIDEKVDRLMEEIERVLDPNSYETLWRRIYKLNHMIRGWFDCYTAVGCSKRIMDATHVSISGIYKEKLDTLLLKKKIISRKLNDAQFDFFGVLPPVKK